MLVKLGQALLNLIPAPVRSKINFIISKKEVILLWIKNSPKLLINKSLFLFSRARHNASGMDYKATLAATYKVALDKYKATQPGKQLSGLKMILLAPFLMMGQWLNGLSAAQSLLLLVFSGASILASVGIVFSGNRMLSTMSEAGREPASAQVEEYDRPAYYKKQTRHLEFTAVRLPVYLPQVNELKSVDIDFTVTFKTREAQLLMSKYEFQLRDHLILNVEPSVATFPLVEEGKQILKEKLQLEVNTFMQEHQIPGEVEEVKITYILAN